MKRNAKSESTYGVTPVNVRFLPSQKAAIDAAARDAGVSRSQWIKEAVAERMKREAAQK